MCRSCHYLRAFDWRFVNPEHGIKKVDKRLYINENKLSTGFIHVRFAQLSCGVLK